MAKSYLGLFCFVFLSFFSAPPVTFKTKLRNQQVEEENSLTLSCELSKPGLAAEWRKGKELLKNDFKYHIKNRNSVMELTIKNAQLEDSGLYSCVYEDVKTTASVTVTRKRQHIKREMSANVLYF